MSNNPALRAVLNAAHAIMKAASTLGLTLVMGSCAEASSTGASSSSGDGVRNLTVNTVVATTIAGTPYSSSTRLAVSWAAAVGVPPDGYVVQWEDLSTNVRWSMPVATTSAIVSGLKAATDYRVVVMPCKGSDCNAAEPAGLTRQTPAETWQLQGAGSGVSGLTRIVADGNVKMHAFRYGLDAPQGLAGRIQLYYGSLLQTAKGLAVATTPSVAQSAVISSFRDFVSQVGTSGLIKPPAAAPLVREVNTGQGVPLNAAMGGRLRLYFEATGSDGRTRILSLDSHDGYIGADFNAGASAVCATQADYSPGGGCVPSVVIGVEGDATLGNTRITNARQFKIGVRTVNDWRWDGAVGSFMVFTTDNISGCTTSGMNQGYAVWTGAMWQVQYAGNGCPKLFQSMQAAHPVHLGGTRFKMYFGNPSDLTGRITSSPLPFLGPKMLVYADGQRTGETTTVDFEDWDPPAAGRRIVFLWPDGTPLSATALGYIDDFSIIMPTDNPSVQVFYVAITDGSVVPFTAAAVLINP